MILVKTFFAYNDLRNYSYLITDKESGYTWAIDPYDPVPMAEYIKSNDLTLKAILNTHQHFDHIKGNAYLKNLFQVPILALKNSEKLIIGKEFSLYCMNTPGHTMDHQVFIWTQHDQPIALFSGDTLFNSGVGNCKDGGNVKLLFETTMKLRNLPENTLLYPGHDYRRRNLEFALSIEPDNRFIKESLQSLDGICSEELLPTTLKEEMKVNPFLRLDSEQIRQNLTKSNPGLFEDEDLKRELFIKLRSLRDHW